MCASRVFAKEWPPTQSVFYPNHEFGCPHVQCCPHLGGHRWAPLYLQPSRRRSGRTPCIGRSSHFCISGHAQRQGLADHPRRGLSRRTAHGLVLRLRPARGADQAALPFAREAIGESVVQVVRPKPLFLALLRRCGAVGEVEDVPGIGNWRLSFLFSPATWRERCRTSLLASVIVPPSSAGPTFAAAPAPAKPPSALRMDDRWTDIRKVLPRSRSRFTSPAVISRRLPCSYHPLGWNTRGRRLSCYAHGASREPVNGQRPRPRPPTPTPGRTPSPDAGPPMPPGL